MTTYPERCIYPDQDAINAVLSDSIIRLDCKYNVQEGWYYQKNKYNCIKNKFWNEIDFAKYNPTIIHYTGKYKPWENLCTHPLKKLYNFYKNILLDE
jgi:lipopolysaccharide biosynthesis glycosyltransferase